MRRLRTHGLQLRLLRELGLFFLVARRFIEDFQKSPINMAAIDTLQVKHKLDLLPPMVTLCIDGGRKSKLRPGDILGALTAESGIAGTQVGKIDIFDHQAYVAIERSMVDQALAQLSSGKMKGRYFKARKLQ